MLRFFRGVKKLMFSFSYFEASQYFRFRKSDAYVHLSAGILSFILQVVLIISLVYQLVAIFSMGSANISITNAYTYPPPNSNIGADSNNFMVAVELVTATSGLTVKFVERTEQGGSKSDRVLGFAQPCTLAHWTGVTLTSDDFANNNMGAWLCMPMAAYATIQGNRNGKLYSYLALDIECVGCSATTVELLLHYKNPLINPASGQSSYLSYYIHSENAISMLNAQSYTAITIALEEFTVETDTTVLPWYVFIANRGLIATDTRVQTVGAATSGYRSQVIFKKASKSTLYTRNIPKIMDAFYFIIGSFAPTLLAFSFFIYPILSSIFQMRFAKYVYRLEEGKQYGLLAFFKENYYVAFRNLCNLDSDKWRRWQKIIEVRQILSKVMQIEYLYERIDFLERSIKFLFKDHHLCGLRLMRKDTIVDAEEKYKNYEIRKAIKNYVIGKQRKQIQELKKVSSKNILAKVDKQRDEDQAFPSKKQSQMIDLKKISLNLNAKKNKYQGTKQFQIIQLDYQSQKMTKRIEQNKQFYLKLINDFKRLKKEAESYDSHDIVGKMIYDDLQQNDIDLMEEFEKRIKEIDRTKEKKDRKASVGTAKDFGVFDDKKRQNLETENKMRSQSMMPSALQGFDSFDELREKPRPKQAK